MAVFENGWRRWTRKEGCGQASCRCFREGLRGCGGAKKAENRKVSTRRRRGDRMITGGWKERCSLRWAPMAPAAVRAGERVSARAARITATPRGSSARFRGGAVRRRDGCRLHGWWIRAPARRARCCTAMATRATSGIGRSCAATCTRWAFMSSCFDYRGYGLSRGLPTGKGHVSRRPRGV